MTGDHNVHTDYFPNALILLDPWLLPLLWTESLLKCSASHSHSQPVVIIVLNCEIPTTSLSNVSPPCLFFIVSINPTSTILRLHFHLDPINLTILTVPHPLCVLITSHVNYIPWYIIIIMPSPPLSFSIGLTHSCGTITSLVRSDSTLMPALHWCSQEKLEGENTCT